MGGAIIMKKRTFVLGVLGGVALGGVALYYIGKKERENQEANEKHLVTLDANQYTSSQEEQLRNNIVEDKNSMFYQDQSLKNQQVKQQVAQLEASDDLNNPLLSDDVLYNSEKELPRRSTVQVALPKPIKKDRLSQDNQQWLNDMLDTNDRIIDQLIGLYPHLNREFILKAITYCQTISNEYKQYEYITITYQLSFYNELDFTLFSHDMYQLNYVVKPEKQKNVYSVEIIEPLKYTKIMSDLLSIANMTYARGGKLIEFGVSVND